MIKYKSEAIGGVCTMSASNELYSLKFTVRVGYLNIEAFINEGYIAPSDTEITFPHNHHNYEIRYVESGVCERVVEGKTFVSNAGDCLIIPPRYYHYTSTEENAPYQEYGMRFDIKPHANPTPSEEHAYKKATALFSKSILLHDKTGHIPSYLKLIRDEVYSKNIGYISVVQSYTSLIFTEIFRMVDSELSTLFPVDDLIFHGRDYMKLDRFFADCASDPQVTVADCARAIQLSTRHTDRTIYKLYGMSFYEKLKEVRLKKAAHLLKYSNKTVGEISTDCGFGSYSAFHACFKREYGVPPSKFRGEH